MTGPVFGFLIGPCLLVACVGSSGGNPSTDASASARDTADSMLAAPDCISSANRMCAPGDAAVASVRADVPVEGKDTSSSSLVPDVASDRPDALSDATRPDTADTSAPDTKTSDLVNRNEDATVPDVVVADAAPSKRDTKIADVLPEVAGPDGKTGGTCAQESFVHLSPSELKALLDGGEDPFLINVKGSSIKNIPGTDAVLANDVAGIEALVKDDVCANIVLYCRSGGTSQTVGSQLITKGYRRVRDLAGGITAWEAAGYPTE